MQQPAHAEGTRAADHADLARRRRPFPRGAGEQLRHAWPHEPAPESMTAQVPGHAAATVRRAQRHDAPGLARWRIMKQRPDQYAAEAVTDEMHGVGVERVKKTCEPFGIRTQIGANGRVGKRMHGKTLAPQTAREHK